MAIAMIMTTALIVKYVSMSELETDDCTVEVGTGELAMLTVANVDAEDE